MKKLIYILIFALSCTQEKKDGISYEIKIAKRNVIDFTIRNNTDKNYFFLYQNLHFIKMNEGSRKNIVTEGVINEIDYNPKYFLLNASDSTKIYIPKSFTGEKCNPVVFKLRAGENIKLQYKILNSAELLHGKYSVIVDQTNCLSDSVKNIKIPQYNYYSDHVVMPTLIDIK